MWCLSACRSCFCKYAKCAYANERGQSDQVAPAQRYAVNQRDMLLQPTVSRSTPVDSTLWWRAHQLLIHLSNWELLRAQQPVASVSAKISWPLLISVCNGCRAGVAGSGHRCRCILPPHGLCETANTPINHRRSSVTMISGSMQLQQHLPGQLSCGHRLSAYRRTSLPCSHAASSPHRRQQRLLARAEKDGDSPNGDWSKDKKDKGQEAKLMEVPLLHLVCLRSFLAETGKQSGGCD